MSMLTDFADFAVKTAQTEFTKLPNVEFRTALMERLSRYHRIPMDISRPIIVKMKVDINEFDEDDDWNRIVNAYAVMFKKLYDIYGKDMIHFEPLSIEYRV